jgi:hypothetical protein
VDYAAMGEPQQQVGNSITYQYHRQNQVGIKKFLEPKETINLCLGGFARDGRATTSSGNDGITYQDHRQNQVVGC